MIALDLKPSQKTLRQFAWFALPGFAIMGALFYFIWGLSTVAYVLWGLALLTPLLGLITARAVLPIYLALTLIGFPIGFIISNVVTILLYYGLFTPIALFFRLTGRDALKRKLDPSDESYWEPAPPSRPVSDYLRQY